MKKLKGNDGEQPDYYVGFYKDGGLKIEWILPYLSIIADGPEPPHDQPMEARSIRLTESQAKELSAFLYDFGGENGWW